METSLDVDIFRKKYFGFLVRTMVTFDISNKKTNNKTFEIVAPFLPRLLDCSPR